MSAAHILFCFVAESGRGGEILTRKSRFGGEQFDVELTPLYSSSLVKDRPTKNPPLRRVGELKSVCRLVAPTLTHDSPNDPLGHSGYGPAFGDPSLHVESLCGEELNPALAII